MIEILILFQNLCLEIGELHNWEWINWGLVQTAINQIWLGEKSGNVKVFTTNHQHQYSYKISSKLLQKIFKIGTKYYQDGYKISSSLLQNSIKIFTKYRQDGYEISSTLLQDIIKIVTKYPQDCYHQNHQKRWLFLHPCGPSDPLMGFCSPNATHPFKFGLKTRRARKLFVLKTLRKYYVIKCYVYVRLH